MCEQIANGVMFLHCWNIVHRDLSARNVLIDANFNLKIADFGLARSDNFVAPDDDVMPIKWTAIESLVRQEYSTKSDIWSIGILMWEIFSLGEIPYPGMVSKEVIRQLKEGYRMNPPLNCPQEIYAMMTDCWTSHAEYQPTAEELFLQLDELKVSVVTAPEGQYYGQHVEYGEAGTVEGPSLDEIHEMKAIMDTKKSSNVLSSAEQVENVEMKSQILGLEIDNDELRMENSELKTEIAELKN